MVLYRSALATRNVRASVRVLMRLSRSRRRSGNGYFIDALPESVSSQVTTLGALRPVISAILPILSAILTSGASASLVFQASEDSFCS